MMASTEAYHTLLTLFFVLRDVLYYTRYIAKNPETRQFLTVQIKRQYKFKGCILDTDKNVHVRQVKISRTWAFI